MSVDVPTQRIGSLKLPQIAERLNDIMHTRKGRQDALSVMGTNSDTMMTQTKDWIDKEMESMREQLDLLEMARWDLSSERKEFEDINNKFVEVFGNIERVREQLLKVSTETEMSELTESYIANFGQYIRNMMKLGMLMEKIDRQSNNLLKYRDSLIDLLRAFGQQASS